MLPEPSTTSHTSRLGVAPTSSNLNNRNERNLLRTILFNWGVLPGGAGYLASRGDEGESKGSGGEALPELKKQMQRWSIICRRQDAAIVTGLCTKPPVSGLAFSCCSVFGAWCHQKSPRTQSPKPKRLDPAHQPEPQRQIRACP